MDTDLYIILGLLYAFCFLILSIRRRDIALLLAIAGAPFQNDLSIGLPIKFSIAEVNLLIITVVFATDIVRGRRQFSLGPVGFPAMLYLLACVLSAVSSWRGSVAVSSLIQTGIYTIVTVAVFAEFPDWSADYRPCFDAYILVASLLGIAATVSATGYVFGLHKNNLGATLGSSVLIATELWFASDTKRRRTVYAAAAAISGVGLIFTLSRGSWIGAMAGLLVMGLVRRAFSLLTRAVVLLLPLTAIAWLSLPKESTDYATDFDSNTYNIRARLEVIDAAKDYFEKEPLFGVGTGLRKEMDATNLVWITLAETGVIGFAAFFFLHVVIGRMIYKEVERVPSSCPEFSYLVIAAGLVADKLAHGMVDHYWVRGSLFVAWASVGMATRVWSTATEALGASALSDPETTLPPTNHRLGGRRVYASVGDREV